MDDGSTDGSGEICAKYAELDSRIKLIKQSNQGVVTARKNGVDLSKGSYVGFVDADDYIDKDLYQQFMEQKDDFDLLISQWFREEGHNVRRAYDRIPLGAYRSVNELKFLSEHLINISSGGGTVKATPHKNKGSKKRENMIK